MSSENQDSGKRLTPIQENWKTIDLYEKKAQEQTGDPEAGYNPTLFFMDGVRKLIINLQYRGKKGKKGEESFTKSYKNISSVARFCPYTGKPLYEESEDLIPNLQKSNV